jgi:hypothetical protein
MSLTRLLVTMMTFVAWVLPQDPILETVEQQLGPFTISGQSFTVVLHQKRLAGRETLALLEVRDSADVVHYQKAFPFPIEGSRFQQTVSASVKLLAGQDLAGLSIRYSRESVVAGRAESWQIFRLREGKLTLFDAPLAAAPNNGLMTASIARGGNAVPMIRRPDTLELRVWTGSFYVIVPLRVDWQQGKTMMGQQCFEMAGNPGLTEVGCEMRVEAQRKPGPSEFTFIRLFNEANENFGNPRHVVLGKDAHIEYLSARALVKWTASGDESAIALTDVWLKVLVDNNEDKLGWIHADEDFAAVGLPAMGPTP